jgi:hypothetical protein
MNFKGQVTAGWELGAATFSAGQTYPLASAAAGTTHRSYFVWEPRLGGLVDAPDGYGFVGGGPTLGYRWDHHEDGPPEGGVIAGVWGGAAYAFPRGSSKCEEKTRAYFSFALGIRGQEIYLAPKAGVMAITPICPF